MILRPRSSSDLDQCVEMMREAYDADGYPAHWPRNPRRFVAPPYELRAWVAVEPDLVVGHVALHDGGQDPAFAVARSVAAVPDEALVAVGRLFTRPGFRGEGLGSRLLAAAVEAAHAAGGQPFLNVLTHLGHAVSLYRREGWKDLGPLSIDLGGGDLIQVLVFLGPPPPSPRVSAGREG
ncbi:MAG TPA: GNAT family N-acetyltransferase [Acidimicrobiales bacterium]|nr:GNAT family N-acetyltransferase [Acidimicrobiales bacterium]